MKRFTLILSLMVAMVTTAMAQIDVTKAYRIKDVNSGEYLKAFNHDTHASGDRGGVGVAALDENSKEQVFYLEPTSNGYFLRLASGDYYVVGQSWNVDAIKQNGTIFNFEDAGEGNFYLKKGGSYFKIQDLGDAKYVFCDAPENARATWVLEVAGESGYATYNTFNANKAYVIKSRERGGLTINEEATEFCSTNDAGRGTFVEYANTDNHFAVVTYDEKSYLYSVKAKKFLKADKSLTEGIGDAVAFRDANSEGASRMSIYFKDVANANINIGGDKEIQVNWWSAVDHGNAMLFIEVADFDPAEALEVFATITYEYQLNGKILAIQEAVATKGEAYPELVVPVLPLGVVVTGAKPAGNVTGDVTVTIALGVDDSKVPFAFVTEKTPTTWYYAQMHAYGGYHWFVAPAADGASVETQDHKFAADETDAHLWGFVGTVEGGFKMVNKATSKAIKSTNSGVAAMAEVADATAFAVMTSPTNGWFCLRHPEGNYLNAQGSDAGEGTCDFVINHWGNNDNGSSFFLTEYVDEDVTVNVSELGWATKYFGESVHVPAGVNAYIITGVNEYGYVVKEQIAEGEVIPANTGVLLEGAGEHSFANTVSYNYTLAGNLMNGSVENSYVEGEAYVLANHSEDGVGFYKAELNFDATGNKVGKETGTHFLNNAGKAYLALPTTSETVAYYGLDWAGTTGIGEVKTENGEVKAIYDLTGRRVEAITAPGIYIINGKKTLVK